jgi:hypothetical protein
MALLVETVPEDVAALAAKLRAALEQHRDLRMRFDETVLDADEMALTTIRARLEKADQAIEKAYAAYREALQRFGARVCEAVQSLIDEEKSGG